MKGDSVLVHCRIEELCGIYSDTTVNLERFRRVKVLEGTQRWIRPMKVNMILRKYTVPEIHRNFATGNPSPPWTRSPGEKLGHIRQLLEVCSLHRFEQTSSVAVNDAEERRPV
jgi:hypothetical protein